jgi:hypothetical protein
VGTTPLMEHSHVSSRSSQQNEQIARPQLAYGSLWGTAGSWHRWSLLVSSPLLVLFFFFFFLCCWRFGLLALFCFSSRMVRIWWGHEWTYRPSWPPH